ncbi:hypothetical protein [Devosia sp. 63-57]|uniref:hypothetical protein n=1 Tax=Devosia sp. 63-57 TaxID=1895751 RepID=UPI00086D50FB|nr:hypothetical protein [Devosia sp. 63-57]ODU84287.1 MAG: hypothetical protein ABT14_14685 [Pelagibacterium sp. SCN 63-17]
MSSYQITSSDQPGFVRITDLASGATQLVFMGGKAQSFDGGALAQPRPDAPSQKWTAVVAA